jgi:Na+/melibiose symporter-like transporter
VPIRSYESRTGRSLYGSFFAIYGIAIKLAGSISLLFTGFVLNATGFQASFGRNQPVSTLTEMRVLNVVLPVTGLMLAFVFLRNVWPKDKEKTSPPNAKLPSLSESVA